MESPEIYESSDEEGDEYTGGEITPPPTYQHKDPVAPITVDRKVKLLNFFNRNTPQTQSLSLSKTRETGAAINNLSPQFIDALSLILDHIICHPFTMFKMQCQVNSLGRWSHVTPFTVIPFLYQQCSTQGIGALWKGLRSSLIYQGMFRFCEITLSGLTNYPVEPKSVQSFKQLLEHLFLKAISCAMMTPFYAMFTMETVQSYSASDALGIFEGISDTFRRMFIFRGSNHRLLSLGMLMLPMAFSGLVHYITYRFVYGTSLLYLRHRVEAEKCFQKDRNLPPPYTPEMEVVYPQVLASIVANFTAVAVVFPFQTALNRLCIQGTRCIIDSTDIAGEVLPINTQYHSFTHCLTTVIRDEGYLGLYRGFGALILHYTLQLSGFYFLQPTIERAIEISKHL